MQSDSLAYYYKTTTTLLIYYYMLAAKDYILVEVLTEPWENIFTRQQHIYMES